MSTKKRNWRTMWSGVNSVRDRVALTNVKVTRPDQALTVEETVVMFNQRGAIRMNRGFHFYDDNLATDTSKMSFEQLHDYSQQVARHAIKLEKAAQQKHAEDREAAIQAEVEKRWKAQQAAQAAEPAAAQ